MNDRTLLELAAKAAGYWNKQFNCYEGPLNFDPLTDDGDALRLACTLGLSVDINNALYQTTIIYEFGDDLSEDHAAGTASATRRAIVRAAAAIGEQMK
jgi:hypothetical protein